MVWGAVQCRALIHGCITSAQRSGPIISPPGCLSLSIFTRRWFSIHPSTDIIRPLKERWAPGCVEMWQFVVNIGEKLLYKHPLYGVINLFIAFWWSPPGPGSILTTQSPSLIKDMADVCVCTNNTVTLLLVGWKYTKSYFFGNKKNSCRTKAVSSFQPFHILFLFYTFIMFRFEILISDCRESWLVWLASKRLSGYQEM